MQLTAFTDFAARRSPAVLAGGATGGVAIFPDSGVVVEYRAANGALTGFAVRDTATGVAIVVDHPDRLEREPELARIADALRADAGLR
jgi:hypothetical protein